METTIRTRDIDLIYCASGNKRYAEIAVSHGFLYGGQLPGTVYTEIAPLYFADQDFKKPRYLAYKRCLARHNPPLATVLDWEEMRRLGEILMRAEEIAKHCQEVLIIPKVVGGIKYLPRQVAGKPVRLAYSVPTGYAKTDVPIDEFGDWPVHLLGGSPLKQLELSRLLNVKSADGNYAQKMASKWNQFFVPDGSARYARNRFWPTLREANGGVNWGDGSAVAGAPYEAFERSCKAIMQMWRSQ